MKKGEYIRVDKLEETEDALSKAGEWDSYKHGQVNGPISIPVGYWVEGYLLLDIKEGYPIVIDRKIRNGEVCNGKFESSFVRLIEGNLAVTDNSKYVITKGYRKDEIQEG